MLGCLAWPTCRRVLSATAGRWPHRAPPHRGTPRLEDPGHRSLASTLSVLAAAARAAAGRPRGEEAFRTAAIAKGWCTISVKEIRLFGDPVLRTPADPVTDFDAELRKLVRDLTDTMLDAPGVGLAAPQIGVGLRVFTYHVDGQLGHLINPSLRLSEEQETDDEGCLSFPGLVYPTPRAYGVVASGFNMHGDPVTVEGTAQLARCVQHETDHLDGVLFIDRLDPVQRKRAMKEIREAEWFGEPVPTVKISPHPTRGKAF